LSTRHHRAEAKTSEPARADRRVGTHTRPDVYIPASSLNGEEIMMTDAPNCVLYTRVSTPGQAERGYSLREQAGRLRDYAEASGLVVLEVVEDAGVSGAAFVGRPGLTRVRELVAQGGVSVVLATERDRFAREPAIAYLLKKELAEHGTKLKALNDQGDDSPVGELTDGMLDQIAKFFKATFAAKSMENKLKKAREGKASGSGTPPYGFAYAADRRALVVDEPTMAVVRRMFSLVADGATVHYVKKTFEAEAVATPGAGARWHPVSMTRMIRNEAYLPHTLEELRSQGVGEEVLAPLDPDALYGLWFYGQNRVTLTPDSPNKRRFEAKPREEWVGTPAPSSSIPRETIEAARANLDDRHRPRRKADRYYELRGLLRCEGCGLILTTYTTGADRVTGRKYAYYVCQSRRKWGADACPAGPRLPAEAAEAEVVRWAEGLLDDPAKLAARMDAAITEARGAANVPEITGRALAEAITALDAKRERLVDLAADGILGKDDLARRLSNLDGERRTLEAELARAQASTGRVEDLVRQKEALLAAFGTGLRLGIGWMPPQLRREVYAALGLRVSVAADGGMRAHAEVDAATVRFSHEVERYAKALIEADERLAEQQRKDPATGRTVEYENPDGSPTVAHVSRQQVEMERAEAELARVRRELSSSSDSDTVMAEVAG